jgi:biotin carboxyl carrier protein
MDKMKKLEIEVGQWQKISMHEGDNPMTILNRKGNKLKVLSNDKVYDVVIKSSDPDHKEYVINVEGYDFQVKVNEPIDLLIKQMGFLKPMSHAIKEIKAPMPGLVLDIYVDTGQEVEENQNILSLEAMKMENILKSHGQGIIKEIKVQKGSAVVKNQVLIIFE